ncbi:hypothetical protein BDZ97DRAFT_1794609 [Flammula alnicola]|nr:hypothetical protein BDZ97DRAFT_1794609 [Flammula alnicola]
MKTVLSSNYSQKGRSQHLRCACIQPHPGLAIKQMRADHMSMPLPDRSKGVPFFAASISLVDHPRNPHVPTLHAYYRYFEITQPLLRCEIPSSPRSSHVGSVADLTCISLRG